MEEQLESARRALEHSLHLEEEDGEVPLRLLSEHQQDTRRKQKLLLTQLRVLSQVLKVLNDPQPPASTPLSTLRSEVSQAGARWRELKGNYGEELGNLGKVLSHGSAQWGRGQRLGRSLKQKEQLVQKLREAQKRRDQLRQLLQEQLSQQGALQKQEQALKRAAIGYHLYQCLTGGWVLPSAPSQL